jgi:hypothetical protein
MGLGSSSDGDVEMLEDSGAMIAAQISNDLNACMQALLKAY